MYLSVYLFFPVFAVALVPYTSISWRRCWCGCLGRVDGVVVCGDGSVVVTGGIAEAVGARWPGAASLWGAGSL